MKKRLFLLVLALAVIPVSAGASPQNGDKVSKSFTVVVGHVVTLGWTASISTNVISYNVYTSSVSGGPYNKVGSTSDIRFKDMKATAGNTYYYVVTAIDNTGLESVFSLEVSAIIPTP